MKSQDKLKTRHKEKKRKEKERRLIWFVWEPPLQLEGDFGTQFWLGLVNTQMLVMMQLTIYILHDLVRSLNFALHRDI